MALKKGIQLFCFTCGRMRIFKDDGKLKCPVCKTKKAIGYGNNPKHKKYGKLVAEGYWKLKDLPKGEFIKRTATAHKVYIKGEYDRGSKTFSIYDAEDVNSEIFVRGTAKVFAGFSY